nr:hypothetical protein [Tanacetum cinerariifolium]
MIMESIHVNFDELPQMESDHISSDPAPECQDNVTQADKTVTMSNELDLLFSLMFDELLNGSSNVESKSFVVCSADAPNQRQQHTTPLNNHTTPAPTCQVPTLEPTISSSENINQVETYVENDQVADDKFINIFCTLVRIVLKCVKITKNRTISTEDQKPQRKARSRSKFSANNLTIQLNLSKV